MLMTSAEAAKYLRKLNEELASLRSREEQSRQFTVSLGEKEEELRPAYDYEAARDAMLALEEKIRRVKHAVNCFNCTTEVPGFGMTVDQMLIYLPQLNMRKLKLAAMKDVLPRTRVARYNSNLVEYTLINYDPEQVAADHEAAADELGRAQNALDVVNTTLRFEVEE
ncbi:MAG: hypothetical protein IJK86_02790 [Lachnospiraceae bacterium]|nr:hypothetical protein [Lachnospiraceae bacterium]